MRIASHDRPKMPMDTGANILYYPAMVDWENIRLVLLGESGVCLCEKNSSQLPRRATCLPEPDLLLICAGRGRMHLRSGWQDLRRGMCIWRREGHDYTAEHDPAAPLGVCYIHHQFYDTAGRRIDPAALHLPEVFRPTDFNMVEAVCRRIVHLLHGRGTKGGLVPCRARAIAVQLLKGVLMDLEAGSRKVNPPDWPGADPRYRKVFDMAERIMREPRNVPSLLVLAAEANYSPRHFCRVFRKLLGRSPQDFVIHWRIERARELLVESDLSIREVAESLGYAEQYFFTNQFKRRTRMTPLHYRQMHRRR